jgi:hypothetical protein
LEFLLSEHDPGLQAAARLVAARPSAWICTGGPNRYRDTVMAGLDRRSRSARAAMTGSAAHPLCSRNKNPDAATIRLIAVVVRKGVQLNFRQAAIGRT